MVMFSSFPFFYDDFLVLLVGGFCWRGWLTALLLVVAAADLPATVAPYGGAVCGLCSCGRSSF